MTDCSPFHVDGTAGIVTKVGTLGRAIAEDTPSTLAEDCDRKGLGDLSGLHCASLALPYCTSTDLH